MKLLLTALLASYSYAGTVTYAINSRPGLENSVTDATVAITPQGAWQPNGAGVWISYAPTGHGDSVFVQPGTMYSIYDFFTLPAGVLNLKVWADNTAAVYLDNVNLFLPNFTDNICADGPIGCQPGEFGQISAAYTSGSHNLRFDVYQGYGSTSTLTNPSGLLYEGAATYSTATPEPPTWGLIGSVLIFAGVWQRRRLRSV